MSSGKTTSNQIPPYQISSQKNINRFKVFVLLFTIFGIGLFSYLLYSVGLDSILEGIVRIGISGFLVLQLIYFLRIVVRAIAWRLSVYELFSF